MVVVVVAVIVILCCVFSIVRSVLCFSFAGFIEIIILIIGNKQRARKFRVQHGAQYTVQRT